MRESQRGRYLSRILRTGTAAGGGGGGGIALVAHTSLTPAANAGGTSPAITTTGANLLCVTVGYYFPNAAALVLSDSKGNIYTTAITKFDGNSSQVTLFYKLNPTVGTGHTFTLAGTATYCTLCAAAFSGVNTVFGIDQVSAGGANSGSPVLPGSITPGATGSLVWAGSSVLGTATPSQTFAIGSGMNALDQVPYLSGQYFGSLGAYLIQTPAAAINPSISYTGTPGAMAAASMSFRAA